MLRRGGAAKAHRHTRAARGAERKAEADRARLLDELDRQKTLLEAVLDQFPYGVVIHEAPSGDIIMYNAQTEAILRMPLRAVPPTELAANYVAWRADDGTRVPSEEYAGVRGLRGETTRQELVFLRGDGTKAVVIDTGTPVRDRRGRIIASVVGLIDVTEQREEERQRARLFEQAQRALRARDEILAVVSHDLRNPLMAIRFGADQVRRGGARGNSDQVRAAAGRIARAAERMDRLIQDLVDVSSIEAGRLFIERGTCDGAGLVAEVLEAFAPIAADKGVQLHASAQLPRGTIACDRLRVVQVLSNLVGNALKFSPPGGHVVIGGSFGAREVTFFVEDDGRGIQPEDLDHVFDRYWQAERPPGGRPPGDRGLGLGLAIAKGIVEAHGGTIRGESQPGRGSTFRFTLPLDVSCGP